MEFESVCIVCTQYEPNSVMFFQSKSDRQGVTPPPPLDFPLPLPTLFFTQCFQIPKILPPLTPTPLTLRKIII